MAANPFSSRQKIYNFAQTRLQLNKRQQSK